MTDWSLILIAGALVILIVDCLSERRKRREDAAWGRERNNLGRRRA